MKTNLLLSLFLFSVISANAQDYKIWFAGAGESYAVDSVQVVNLSQDINLTLDGNDTLHLSGTVGIIPGAETSPRTLRVYPNPVTDKTLLEFDASSTGMTYIEIYNISGSLLFRRQYLLQSGRCKFDISGLSFGVNILKVQSESYIYSAKIVCISNGPDRIRINLVSNSLKSTAQTKIKATKSMVLMPYNDGDQLLITCFSQTYSAVIPLIPIMDMLITANFVDCTDGNGNNYGSITINGSGRGGRPERNTQVWMARNLDVGTRIDGSQAQTNNGILEKYCFANDTNNCNIYGGLYLWDEAMQYVSSEEAQGICPQGWHIPTDQEWCTYQTLIDPTTDCSTNWPGYDAGRKMKSTTGWEVGNGTNSSGFTALPGALRDPNGVFLNYIGCATWWWSSTQYSATDAYARQIYCTRDEVSREADDKENAFSVRCISDFSLPNMTTSVITNITETGATGGGNIVSDGGTLVMDRGICWSTSPNPTLSDSHTSDGSGIGIFVSILNGLTLNTLYYTRAYAINDVGTGYGNEVTFVTTSTTSSLPTVVTSSLSNITQTSATSGGDVLSDGGATVTARGVCWAPSQLPTIEDSFTVDGSGTGAFVSNLAGLDSNATYYVRAYATSSVGTAYGNEVVFSTLPSIYPCGGITSVTYEGETYHAVEIGFQCWFNENLNVGTRINGSLGQKNNGIIEKYCYNDNDFNCNSSGGLYQWPEAMQYITTEGAQGICPSGWHVAKESDWALLAVYLGGFQIAGEKMKSADAGWQPGCFGTNSSGFTAVPGGLHNEDGYCCLDAVYYWTSTQFATGLAKAHDIFCSDALWPDTNYTTWAYSVRCIKD